MHCKDNKETHELPTTLAKRNFLRKEDWLGMTKKNDYVFVLDNKNNKLSPCKINKAWYLIRKNKAIQIKKYPMIIQLNKEVLKNKDKSEFICGIDDGSIHVGIAIIQKCKTKNKVIFKGVIEQRKNVKTLINSKKGHRKYRRSHKRYRPARFNNRSSSKRKNRIPPSILQKKQTILRVVNNLNKYINLSEYHLEDVKINIKSLFDKNIYQKSNRLDENIRKATILRDCCKCMECGKTNCKLEVHHIVPKRLKGNNSVDNLITLCNNCHQKIKNLEGEFILHYQNMINGKSIRFDYAQHVMQGKTYLRKELSKLGKLLLTTGGDTANARFNLNVEKSHSNDAIIISGLIIHKKQFEIKEWIIKPMRKKFKGKKQTINGMKHRDLVIYTNTKNQKIIGYITAMYESKNQINIQTKTIHLKRYGCKRVKLLWRFDSIYWI